MCVSVCVCEFMLQSTMALKRAALSGVRGFNYRLCCVCVCGCRRVCVCVYVCWEGVNTEIKQVELNGLLADKMKESDNEDWAETWERAALCSFARVEERMWLKKDTRKTEERDEE